MIPLATFPAAANVRASAAAPMLPAVPAAGVKGKEIEAKEAESLKPNINWRQLAVGDQHPCMRWRTTLAAETQKTLMKVAQAGYFLSSLNQVGVYSYPGFNQKDLSSEQFYKDFMANKTIKKKNLPLECALFDSCNVASMLKVGTTIIKVTFCANYMIFCPHLEEHRRLLDSWLDKNVTKDSTQKKKINFDYIVNPKEGDLHFLFGILVIQDVQKRFLKEHSFGAMAVSMSGFHKLHVLEEDAIATVEVVPWL